MTLTNTNVDSRPILVKIKSRLDFAAETMAKKEEELKREELIIGYTMQSFIGSLSGLIFF
mgnify:FL=1